MYRCRELDQISGRGEEVIEGRNKEPEGVEVRRWRGGEDDMSRWQIWLGTCWGLEIDESDY